MTITTTNGESFTDQEHAEMARLIYKRFGRDPKSATKAWQRLMENNCTEQQFMELVEKYTAPIVCVLQEYGDNDYHGSEANLGYTLNIDEAIQWVEEKKANPRTCSCGFTHSYGFSRVSDIKHSS
jgi:hypothetical protein